MTPLARVSRFYRGVWNERNNEEAKYLIADDFVFRGSLGSERRGREDFLAYVDEVHAALADYRCKVEDIVVSGPRVAARMMFTGVHRGPLLGFEATGRQVSWAGAAFFTDRDNRLAELWVLGDLDALKAQLGA